MLGSTCRRSRTGKIQMDINSLNTISLTKYNFD